MRLPFVFVLQLATLCLILWTVSTWILLAVLHGSAWRKVVMRSAPPVAEPNVLGGGNLVLKLPNQVVLRDAIFMDGAFWVVSHQFDNISRALTRHQQAGDFGWALPWSMCSYLAERETNLTRGMADDPTAAMLLRLQTPEDARVAPRSCEHGACQLVCPHMWTGLHIHGHKTLYVQVSHSASHEPIHEPTPQAKHGLSRT